ncbi:MAG: cytochrome c biogenesis protein CcdA [Desulfuromonadales bacterium]|nr:cytochrome c biogenesis protein CcdA [Desulfuromonadales bacterium]
MEPITLSTPAVLMAILAGFTSVASPCVLPIVPIVCTGTAEDHKIRPVMIVAGLSLSFMGMGAISSIFGGMIASYIPFLEKIAGVVILLFGILMIFDVNLFKKLSFFNNIQARGKGRWSGLVMGLTLGLVWIPCVGPMLSGVLTVVATDGKLLNGLTLLSFYSLGFAVPMLIVGYASQSVRQRMRFLNRHPLIIRLISGCLLIAFGTLILTVGMLSLGSTF